MELAKAKKNLAPPGSSIKFIFLNGPDGPSKDFTISVRVIYLTGWVVWALPFAVFMGMCILIGYLLQLFYLIRYPLDLYLWSILSSKKNKPKVKTSFIWDI